MSASVSGFELGNINVDQTLLAKMTPEGKSNVPAPTLTSTSNLFNANHWKSL